MFLPLRNIAPIAGTQLETQRNFIANSFALCNILERVEKTTETLLVTNEAKAAFITYDYDFQHNWALFAQIMKRGRDWKNANNFYSNDKFSVQENVYLFSDGLHRSYRDRLEGCLKVLLSSRIYGF